MDESDYEIRTVTRRAPPSRPVAGLLALTLAALLLGLPLAALVLDLVRLLAAAAGV